MLNPQVGVLAGTFFYVTALMICTIILPLRMSALGFSPLEIGMVVAITAIVSALGHLVGGVLCDRYGGHRMLTLSYVFITVAALGLMISTSFVAIILSMILRGGASGIFWPATLVYASLISPAKSSFILGRHASMVAVGSLLGVMGGGYIAQYFGYVTSFGIAAAIGFFAFISGLLLPELVSGKEIVRQNIKTVFQNTFALFLANKALTLAFCSALIAAIPVAFIGSFYPLYFTSLGFAAGLVGLLSGMLHIGSFFMGLAFGRLYNCLGSYRTFAVGLVTLGASLILMKFAAALIPLLLVMLLQGFAMSMVMVLRTIIITSHTSTEERGSGMGIMELGFSVSLTFMPVLTAMLIESMPTENAFLLWGVLLIALVSLLRPLFNWAGVPHLNKR